MSIFDRWSGKVSGFLDDVLLPDDLRTTLRRAQKALDEEDWGEALRLLKTIEERKPGLGRVHEMKGIAFLGLQQHEEAIEELRQAAAQRSEPDPLRHLARALEAHGDTRNARDILREALLHNPGPTARFAIHCDLGRLHERLNRPDKAARELRKAIRIAQEEPEISLRDLERTAVSLARVLLHRKEPSLARQTLEDHLKGRVESPVQTAALTEEALDVLGELLLQENDPQEALQCFESMLTRTVPNTTARLKAGRAAFESGNLEKARNHLSTVLDRAPRPYKADALLWLGQTELAAGNPQTALQHLQSARGESSDRPEILGALAWATLEIATTHRAEQRHEEAVNLARKAESLFSRYRAQRPKDTRALHGAGLCREIRGDQGAARRILQSAVDAGADEKAQLDLAEAHLLNNDPASAVAVLARILASGSKDETTLERARASLERAHTRLAPDMGIPEEGSRDLKALTNALQALQDRAAQNPRLHPFLAAIRQQLRAIDAPLDIAIVGEFNAGKSTLVNALLGEKVVPTGVLPTTAHINVLRFGPRRAAHLHKKDQSIEEVAYREVKKQIKWDDQDRTIAHIEYLHPHPDLRRVHIWDTPGFNALDPDHEKHARDALSRAEVILWLLDANQPLTDSELQILEEIQAPEERLVVVLNKIDKLGDPETRTPQVETILAHIQEPLKNKTAGIFPLSGLEAFDGLQKENPEKLSQSGFSSFQTFLSDEIFDRTARLKALDADRSLTRQAQDITNFAQNLGARFERLQEHIHALQDGVLGEKKNFRQDTEQERRRLRDGVDMLLSISAREIDEALHPGSGLFDAIFTRMELDEEDISFVLQLMDERFHDLLQRSEARVQVVLRETDGRLMDGVDTLIADLDPGDIQTLQKRMASWAEQAQAMRGSLQSRIYGQLRAQAQGRLSSPHASISIRKAAHRDADEAARKTLLRKLLPDVDEAIRIGLHAWSQEYFQAALKFCEVLRGDLRVMAIEARALGEGLQDRAPSSSNQTPEEPDAPL